jgi:hypothetical protein
VAEPVDIKCYRCAYEFVSVAPKRTQCTKCKTNLRVERNDFDGSASASEHGSVLNGWTALVGIVVAVAVMLWGRRRR